MALRLAVSVLSAALIFSGTLASAQDAPRLPRVFVESTSEPTGALAVVGTPGTAGRLEIGARLALGSPDDLGPPFAQRMAAYAHRQIPVWIATAAPGTLDAVPRWQEALRSVLTAHDDSIPIIEVVFDEQPHALVRYVLQVAATEARATRPTRVVAVSGASAAATERLARSLGQELAPYVDVIAASSDVSPAVVAIALSRIPALRVVRRDLDAGDASAAPERMVRHLLNAVATEEIASAWRGMPAGIVAALRALEPAASLLTHDLQAIDPRAAELTLTRRGRDASGAVQARLLFDEETFSTYLIYEGAPSPEPIDVGVRVTVGGSPVILDLVTGEKRQLRRYVRDPATSLARAELPLTGRPLLVDFSEGAEAQFVDRTSVAAERQLTIEEIIARHRQFQARHDVLLRNYRATALMEQHFRPSLTDPGYDVVTENEYFVDDEGVEWEERSFSVNGSKWGTDRPPFPLLQPEKVLSLPLELRLDQDYRYALDGVERVDDVDCFRVRFEPTRDDAALYRGTVWIDRQTFARRRVRAVQTRTAAPVVSNEEVHTYEQVAELDGFPMVLLTKLSARQIVLIAGRNILLEKAATFSSFRVNDEEFTQARAAARRGPRVMYRDTERGVRYLVREGETRVISERATASARAMAMGVLVDPSFAFPLPIFGINYLDFEFRGRPDTQFALLFGGVLAAGNLQRPRIGGSNFDASLDFFGIAAPASDRLFVEGDEREAEALLTWPLSTGVNLGWQYTAFQKAQLQYQLRYDPFVRDRTTDASFVVPSSTLTQGIGGAWEYKRGGYSVAANGAYYARANWKPWGPADAIDVDAPRTYAKYAVHLTRDFFIGAFQKVHVNASYFGGERLDRFSRYQFGMFDDTRIHGVPASGVRFDNLGMLRGSYSFNIFEQYRLDLFAEQAWGQDRTVDTMWQPLTGLGFAVNLRAPWNTILRVDMGKSLLPDRYADAGSTVFQVMLLKPLGGR